jgi:hypothetical protein
MTNLALCKITGLDYDAVRMLPREACEMLVEDLNKQTEQQESLA